MKQSGFRVRVTTLLVYSIVAFAGLRQILIRGGMIGRHWDWSIPTFPELLANMSSLQLSAWTPIALGSYVRFRYGSAVPLLILGLPGHVGVTGEVVAKLLLLTTTVLAGYGMFRFVSTLCSTALSPAQLKGVSEGLPFVPLMGGLIYMLAPFHYNQTVAGDVLGLIAYASAPHAGVSLLKTAFAESNRQRSAIIAGILLALVAASSVHTFILTAALLIPFLILIKYREMKRLAKSLGLVFGTWVVASAYWLIPLLAIEDTRRALVSTTVDLSYVTSSIGRYSSFVRGMVGTSYWTSFYADALPGSFSKVWTFLVLALIGLVLVRALQLFVGEPNAQSRRVYGYWIVAYLVASALAAPGSIVAFPLRFLYEHSTSWTFLFRTPQHLAFLSPFCLAVLAPLALARPWVGVWRNRKFTGPSWALARTSMGISLGTLMSVAFVLGSDFQGYLGPFPTEAGHQTVYSLLQNDPDRQARVISLPGGVSRLFTDRTIRVLSEEAGDDGDLVWGTHPAVTPEIKWSPYPESRTFQRLVIGSLLRNTQHAGPLLELAAVKYVVLTPFFSSGGGPDYLTWDREEVERRLQEADYLQELYSDGDWALWQNTEYSGRVSVESFPTLQTEQGNALVAATAALSRTNEQGAEHVVIESSETESDPTVVNLAPRVATPGRPQRLPVKLESTNGNRQVFRSDGARTTSVIATLKRQDLVGFFGVRKRALADVQSVFGMPGSFIEFEFRSSVGGEFLVWLLGGDEGRFDWRFEATPRWTRQIIPLESLPPVGTIRWNRVSTIRFASVGVVSRGAHFDVRNVLLHLPLQGGPNVGMTGWFVQESMPPAVWNYFDPYPAPVFRSSTSYDGDPTLTFSFEVSLPGTYHVAAVGVSMPPIRWAVDEGAEQRVETPSDREIAVVEFGAVELAAGSHVLRLIADCPDPHSCDSRLLNVVLTPALTPWTPPQDGPAVRFDMHSPTEFTGSVDTDETALILLRDSFDGGWKATATARASNQAIELPHVRASGVFNAWTLPAGEWQISIRFLPQRLYATSLMVSLLGTLAIALWVNAASQRLSGHHRRLRHVRQER